MVSFDRDEDWGILVQFTYPDTPINLDLLERIVNKRGNIWVIEPESMPQTGAVIRSTSDVILTQEDILEVKIDRSIFPLMVKLVLNPNGENGLLPEKNEALYLVVDHEVFSSTPLTLLNDHELGLEGLKEEDATLLMVYVNHGLLPKELQINMEEVED